MADAQNERTNSRNRRRGRGKNRNQEAATPAPQAVQRNADIVVPTVASEPVRPAKFVRPANITPPTERSEEYCTHHMASFTEHPPMQTRTDMTTIRHLQVDHFGEATLYCDCLHNGPHEWPTSMQILETAIELDQFINPSTSEA